RLIRRRPNLDSRVRENDESRGEHVLRIETIFMLCRRAQAHGHFVVKISFAIQRHSLNFPPDVDKK
ncbi:MAG: hypothetical protein ACXWX7_12985, partial [Candidatus Binatia bacterium]